MNSLFRSLTRVPLRQSIRPVASIPTFSRAFSIRSSLFNQQPSSTPTTNASTTPAETKPKAKKLPDLAPLKLAHDLYAVIRVHNNPFLITEGDIINLPFRLNTAQVGDVLHFTDVTTIGTRNFTYSHDPIDPKLFSIKAVVIEKTRMPMRIREVTKRRHRKVRHAISKPWKTRLRVSELKLN